MAHYKIEVKTSVAMDFEAIDSKAGRSRALAMIAALDDDVRPKNCEKLPEHHDYYRIRSGRHRIIYQVDDLRKQVTIFRIGQRRRQEPAW